MSGADGKSEHVDSIEFSEPGATIALASDLDHVDVARVCNRHGSGHRGRLLLGWSAFLALSMNDEAMLVRDIMSRDVATLDRNESLLVADEVMRLGRIRHLPVVDENGSLVGIVSQRDLFHSGLLRALGYGSHAKQQALGLLVLKEAMKTDVVTVSPDTRLSVAAKIMLERKIGCVVVVEGMKIQGIVTESDFVKLALRD
jgi:CBS domain-containing protein